MKRTFRPVVIRSTYAELPVYSKGSYKYALVDIEDADLVQNYFWSLNGNYARAQVNGKYIYLHRLVMGAPKEKQVDHINHQPLDCRKTNLRLCTNQQNQMNRGKTVSSTGEKGVSKHGNGYRATIKLNGNSIRLGTYRTLEDASRAYRDAATKLFKEFAGV